ncbi:MAG: hypothetical protein AAGB93_06465 [Planctomycetota bacterium]
MPAILALLALVLTPAARGPVAPGPARQADGDADVQVDDRRLRPIAKALGDVFEARAERSSTARPRAALREAAGELAGEIGLEDLLRAPRIVGRAWALTTPRERSKVKKGKVADLVRELPGFEGPGLALAVRVPRKFRPRDETYPLVIVVPPRGRSPRSAIERFLGRDLAAESEQDLRDGAIVVSVDLPSDLAAWPTVTHAGAPGGIRHVLAALADAERTLPIDRERVHLVGMGEGAMLALHVADFRPDRFASVVALNGQPDDLDGRPGPANLATVPVYFESASDGALRYVTECANEGHENATTATGWSAGGPWSWIAAHRRDAAPARVVVQPGVSFPTRVHWLSVDSNARDSRAEATIDRDANRIEIVATGAASVGLLLNDDLVDLDRALEVVVNGQVNRVSAYREWVTALDRMVDGTSDPGRVYVAEARVPVPAAK